MEAITITLTISAIDKPHRLSGGYICYLRNTDSQLNPYVALVVQPGSDEVLHVTEPGSEPYARSLAEYWAVGREIEAEEKAEAERIREAQYAKTTEMEG
jgi:hypothetical protein